MLVAACCAECADGRDYRERFNLLADAIRTSASWSTSPTTRRIAATDLEWKNFRPSYRAAVTNRFVGTVLPQPFHCRPNVAGLKACRGWWPHRRSGPLVRA